MGRVRVFYGHEGIVRPTGLRPRSAAQAAPVEEPEVDEIVSDDPNGEPVEIVGEIVADGDDVTPAVVDGAAVGDDGVPVLESADDADDETEDDDAETADADGETVDADAEIDDDEAETVDDDGDETAAVALPDDSWTGPDLDAFAEEHGIDLTGAKKTKGDKLARILDTLNKEK